MYQLSMNVAGHVIFNQRVDWQQPGESKSDVDHEALCSSHPLPPPGHTMSLVGALSKLTLHLPFIIVFPPWVLRLLPFKAAKVARQAYWECDRYMDELLKAETISMATASAADTPRDNLVTALLRSNEQPAEGNESAGDGRAGFTMREMKGNMFVFLLAG